MVIHPKLLLCLLLWKQRKEPPMDHGQLSMVADKFPWVFSEVLLNACGTAAKFCRRRRALTRFRLVLALTATRASQRVETLADFHRGFNALFDPTITYKAFYHQVAKPRFATCMGTMASRREHSVILTFPVTAVDSAQTPDRVCRYTWHIAGLTCAGCSPHTT